MISSLSILLRLLRVTCVTLLLAGPPATAQPSDVHVVERGDTLFSIARTYGTTVADLIQANGLATNSIAVGDRLRIPADNALPAVPDTPPRPAVPDATGALVHTVQRGETLYRLSVWYDASVEELMAWNGMTATTLAVGQRVVVRPGPTVAEVTGPPPAPPDTDTADPEASDPRPPDGSAPATPVPPPSEPEAPAFDLPEQAAPAPPPEDAEDAPSPTEETPPEETPPVEEVPATEETAATDDDAASGLSDADFADEDRVSPPTTPTEAAAREPLPPPRALLPAESVRLAEAPRAFEITDTTVPADEVHLVRRGETLYAVAARYQIPTQALVDVNPGLTTAPLVAGQLLHLPEEVGTMQYHRTVQAPLPPPDAAGEVLVYPDGLAGRAMASGVAYDPDALVGSHRELPFGTIVLVTNPATQRSTFVRIGDRGPVSEGFVMELSARAAAALGLDPDQTARVELRRVP